MSTTGLSLKTRLLIGFGIITLLTALLGSTALLEMDQLARLTTDLYEHPLAVSNAARDIRTHIVAIHRSMKDVVLATDQRQIETAAAQIDRRERAVDELFDVIHERFLGDQHDVQQARDAFGAWRPIRSEVFVLLEDGDVAGAAGITRGKGAEHVALMERRVNHMSDFARERANDFYVEADRAGRNALVQMCIMLIVAVVSSVFVASVISRGITVPLTHIAGKVSKIASGDFSQTLPIQGADEIARLASAVNQMTRDLRRSTTSIERLNEEIIERQRVAEALEQSETRLRSIVESTAEGLVVADRDGNMVLMNPAAEELLGASATSLPASEWQKHYGIFRNEELEPFAQDDMALRRALRGASTDNVEQFICNPGVPDGRWVLTSGRPIRGGDGRVTGGVIVMQDITERKRLQDQLLESQKMRAIGQLAGGVAHDFNNLLYVMLGYTELAIGETEESEPLHSHLEQVHTAGNRAKELVDQILAFSRQQKREHRLLAVQDVLEETLGFLRSSIPSTIEIRQRIDSSCRPILADPTSIHQVIMNLVTNAYQAMRDHGGILDVHLEELGIDAVLSVEHGDIAPGDYVHLMVRDTGHGMDEETARRIFEPYFTTKELRRGTGLGLATVHGVVTSLGGSIQVGSRLGEGTCFDVFLPVHQAADPTPVAD